MALLNSDEPFLKSIDEKHFVRNEKSFCRKEWKNDTSMQLVS